MSEGNKHFLSMAFDGATDKTVIISYADFASKQAALKVLPDLCIPKSYPHHPVYALMGAISGKFQSGVSQIQISSNAIPVDVLISKNNTLQPR